MSNYMDRIRIFEGTKALAQTNDYLHQAIAASQQNQRIFWEGEPIAYGDPGFEGDTDMVLSMKKTVEAAMPYARAGKRVAILNFASSVSPGGGVTSGSQAQEESICRVSTLYFALSHPETAGKFYDRHWELIRAGEMNRRNTDDIIYTPGVVVVRNDARDEELMDQKDWFCVDVITCAAPDLRRTRDYTMFAPDRETLLEVFKQRWSRILASAAGHGAEVVILGAFGCGVFDNPPDVVAKAFNSVAETFRGYFKTIEFAVYSRSTEDRNYRAFSNIRNIRCPDRD